MRRSSLFLLVSTFISSQAAELKLPLKDRELLERAANPGAPLTEQDKARQKQLEAEIRARARLRYAKILRLAAHEVATRNKATLEEVLTSGPQK